MERHTTVLVLVPVLVLAGCLGGPAAETGPSDATDVSPEQVPGVTNGTLSDASALVEANRNAVTTDGAVLQINQSGKRMDIDARLVVGANFSTYSLSGSGTVGNESTVIDQWSNGTTQFVRTSSAGETNYRVLDGREDRLTLLSSVGQFLSAGDFEVADETAGDGMVVLTADNVSEGRTSMAAPERFDGRLVVSESGQIQNLSVTLTRAGEQVAYSYELRQAGVESVPRPDWIADVPPGATVQAQLSVDVEDDSYLVLEHSGGDVVPTATTVRIESNGTTGTVSLDSSLSAGDTRYLYFDAASKQLRAAVDRPARSAVAPVTSPVSVRIVTEDGAVLHRVSMAWGSESASGGDGGSGGSSETSGSSSGSASGSTETAETSARSTGE